MKLCDLESTGGLLIQKRMSLHFKEKGMKHGKSHLEKYFSFFQNLREGMTGH